MMTELTKLQQTITQCELCPRLTDWRREVARKKRRMYAHWDYWGKPLPAFGDPQAQVLLLGLAPAAHGGNRTGRMFTGDRSGDWVFGALHRFGFASQPDSTHRGDGQSLTGAYITAALRCAPPQNKPSKEELANCQPYLLREFELLTKLRVVVALGRIAFDAYMRLLGAQGHRLPSPRPKFGHGVVHELPKGRFLVCSYHPSQQNTQTGRLTEAMFDEVFETSSLSSSFPLDGGRLEPAPANAGDGGDSSADSEAPRRIPHALVSSPSMGED